MSTAMADFFEKRVQEQNEAANVPPISTAKPKPKRRICLSFCYGEFIYTESHTGKEVRGSESDHTRKALIAKAQKNAKEQKALLIFQEGFSVVRKEDYR